MKLLKYLGLAALVLLLLFIAAIYAIWVHGHDYSGTISEFRDLGPPEGICFSLDGKYPKEKLMLRIEGPNVKKFLLVGDKDILPHEGDHVQIKGLIQSYAGRDGSRHNMVVVTDPSQIIIETSLPAK